VTDTELPAFVTVFANLRRVFALRATPEELARIQGLYFQVFRRYTLDDVEAGAQAWLASGAKFPKPHEWIRSMPREAGDGLVGLSPVPVDEVAELREAIQLRYVGDSCSCYLCQQAGVSHRFLRHVPLEDEHGHSIRAVLDGHPVTRGRWIHGVELRDWYAAHDAFAADLSRYIPKAFPPRVRRQKVQQMAALVEEVEQLRARLQATNSVARQFVRGSIVTDTQEVVDVANETV